MSHTLFTHPSVRRWVPPPLVPQLPKAEDWKAAATLICRLNYLIKVRPCFKRRRQTSLFVLSDLKAWEVSNPSPWLYKPESFTDSVSLVFLIERVNCDVMKRWGTYWAQEFNSSHDSDGDCDGNDYFSWFNKIWTPGRLCIWFIYTVMHTHPLLFVWPKYNYEYEC